MSKLLQSAALWLEEVGGYRVCVMVEEKSHESLLEAVGLAHACFPPSPKERKRKSWSTVCGRFMKRICKAGQLWDLLHFLASPIAWLLVIYGLSQRCWQAIGNFGTSWKVFGVWLNLVTHSDRPLGTCTSGAGRNVARALHSFLRQWEYLTWMGCVCVRECFLSVCIFPLSPLKLLSKPEVSVFLRNCRLLACWPPCSYLAGLVLIPWSRLSFRLRNLHAFIFLLCEETHTCWSSLCVF